MRLVWLAAAALLVLSIAQVKVVAQEPVATETPTPTPGWPEVRGDLATLVAEQRLEGTTVARAVAASEALSNTAVVMTRAVAAGNLVGLQTAMLVVLAIAFGVAIAMGVALGGGS